MELTALRYFVTVARKLHFRRAAVELNITQAPLSAAIRKLEDELDVRLFNRTSRTVELTEAGKFFLSEAEAVLNRAEQAQKRLQGFLEEQSEKVVIGYNEPAIHSFLPGVLAKARRAKAGLQLQLRELETAEQWEMLKKGELDIGFMRPFDMDISGFAAQLVLREKYVLAIPEDHPLVRVEKIDGKALAGKNIILFAREVNPSTFDHLTGILCAECPEVPHFRQDARNKSSMLAMVQAGFGAALLPESCRNGAPDGVIFREVELDLPPVDIMAVWDPENAGKTLRDFLKYIPFHTAVS